MKSITAVLFASIAFAGHSSASAQTSDLTEVPAEPPPPDARFYVRSDFPKHRLHHTLGLLPPHVVADRIQGEATVNCQAGANNIFVRCAVLSETPEGYGFGKATAGMFLILGEGTPVASRVWGNFKPTWDVKPGEWKKFTYRWTL